jgi:hypothetical protein
MLLPNLGGGSPLQAYEAGAAGSPVQGPVFDERLIFAEGPGRAPTHLRSMSDQPEGHRAEHRCISMAT